MSDDQPQNQPVSDDTLDIQAQVAEVLAQEAAALPATIPQEITSKFVLECLDANELGDGLLYAALHQDKFVFAKGSESWYFWDHHSWRRDEMDQAVAAVETVALRYAQEIPLQAAALSESLRVDDGKAESFKARIGQLHGRVKRLRKESGRKNCLAFAHTNPVLPLAVRAADFDLNPWQLACANGVINLKTGELEPGRQADYISKRALATFPGLDVDLTPWTDILMSIYSEDADMVEYMQRLYGYSLWGERITDHVFPVLVGRGRNGKSLVVEALFHALGDYAGPVPAELLLENRTQSANQTDPVLLALKGLRLAVASETAEGRKFGAEKVKWLTGGDKITARGLYDKRPITFAPTHLLVLLTNHAPNAPGTDTAFWERCRLIMHKLSFVTREADEELKPYERPANRELPGFLRAHSGIILAWLVKGCLAWQKKNGPGLSPPDAVREGTKEYQDQENDLGQFLEEACVQGAGYKIKATDLYQAYVHWYKNTVNDKDKYRPSQKMFGGRLNSLDLFERKKSGGMVYIGVAISPEYQELIDTDEAKRQPAYHSKWDDR